MKHSKEFLLDLHKQLIRGRLMEQKLLDTYAQGRVPGHIHSGIGQEAAFLGVLATKQEGDYWKPVHRMHSLAFLMGMDEDMYWQELLGKKGGNSGGRGGMLHIGDRKTGFMGFSATLGNDAGVCVGTAMAIDYDNKPNVVYMFMGDGTSSRGPVYEAINMAKIWNLPVLFICENNQFAISTPASYSIPVKDALAGRASGWELPTKVVEGTDVLAVYDAAKELTDNMRKGGGPAILETKSYRWRGHFEGDSCSYRDPEVTKWYMENKDCLKIFEAKLAEEGILPSQEEIDAFKAAFDKQMDEAILRAEAAPEMDPSEIFDGLYA